MLMGQLSTLSQEYVARINARWEDASATIFATRSVPGYTQGSDFATAVIRELQGIRDPTLLGSMRSSAQQALKSFFQQLVSMVRLRPDAFPAFAPTDIQYSP